MEGVDIGSQSFDNSLDFKGSHGQIEGTDAFVFEGSASETGHLKSTASPTTHQQQKLLEISAIRNRLETLQTNLIKQTSSSLLEIHKKNEEITSLEKKLEDERSKNRVLELENKSLSQKTYLLEHKIRSYIEEINLKTLQNDVYYSQIVTLEDIVESSGKEFANSNQNPTAEERYRELQKSHKLLLEAFQNLEVQTSKLQESEEAAQNSLRAGLEGFRLQKQQFEKEICSIQHEKDVIRGLLNEVRGEYQTKCREYESLRDQYSDILKDKDTTEFEMKQKDLRIYNLEQKYLETLQAAGQIKTECDAQYLELATELESRELNYAESLKLLTDELSQLKILAGERLQQGMTHQPHDKGIFDPDRDLFHAFMSELSGMLLIDPNESDYTAYLKAIQSLVVGQSGNRIDSYQTTHQKQGLHITGESLMDGNSTQPNDDVKAAQIKEQQETIKSLRSQLTKLSERYVQSIGSIMRHTESAEPIHESSFTASFQESAQPSDGDQDSSRDGLPLKPASRNLRIATDLKTSPNPPSPTLVFSPAFSTDPTTPPKMRPNSKAAQTMGASSMRRSSPSNSPLGKAGQAQQPQPMPLSRRASGSSNTQSGGSKVTGATNSRR